MPKAWQCIELGEPLAYNEIEAAKPQDLTYDPEGGVVVEVLTSGVDFVATLMIQGKYQFPAPCPFVPGAEVCGIVSSVGANVKGVSPGDLVHVATQIGGFAEQVVVHERQCLKLPPNLNLLSQPSMYGYQTSLFALRDRAELQPGETLLVLGAAGGVGEWCKGSAIMKNFIREHGIRNSTLQLTKFAVMMLVSTHWMGCSRGVCVHGA
jgi:NADPH2:quinone reductase